MATFRKICELALGELDVLTAGSDATAEDLDRCMDALVYWLDQESISGLMQSGRERLSHSFSGRAALRHSVGPAADIPLELPAQLEQVLFRPASLTDPRPLDEVSLAAISRYSDAESASSPLMYNIEKSEPGSIMFDSPPRSGDQVVFVGSVWLTIDRAAASPDMEIGLPRGYDRALYLGLAIEVAGPYGVAVTRTLLERHRDAMSKLKFRNVSPSDVHYDPALSRNSARQI